MKWVCVCVCFFCKKVENGVFCKKVEYGGCFCKKWTFPQRRVHYVQYQYFIFYILLICTQRTPCLRACYGALLKITDIELGGTSIIFDPSPVPGRYISPLE